MILAWTAWVADVLVFLGLAVMTIGVYGLIRMPDIYMRLHAMSKTVFLGVIAFLGASMATRDADVIYRAILIAVALLLTTPVSAHVVARAAFLRRDRMESPDALDESGRLAAGATITLEPGAEEGPEGRSVVVGYDGSPESRRALERATRLAANGGIVTIVASLDPLPRAPGEAAAGATRSESVRQLLDEAERALADARVEVRTIDALGDPADAILAAAERVDADVVVVGSRPRPRAARALLGSVSARVVRDAPCDVLVVR